MKRTSGLLLGVLLLTACLRDLDLSGSGWCEGEVCPPLTPSEDAGSDGGNGTDGGKDGGTDGGVTCPAGHGVCPTGAIACLDFNGSWPPGQGWELVVREFDDDPPTAGQIGVLEQAVGPGCNTSGTAHMSMTGELRTMLQRSLPGDRKLSMRAMFYLPAVDEPLANTSLFIVNGGSDAVSIGVDDDTRQLYIHSTPASDYAYPSTPLVPADRWFCLEAQVQLGTDTTSGRVEVWMDGQSVFASGLRTATSSSTLTELLRVGLSVNNNQTAPVSAYLDDLVVARERIGCP